MAQNNRTPKNLESMMAAAGGPLNLLRGTNLGSRPNVPLTITALFPGIPPEFTNWRDEARAWQNSCALLEQSYHMTEIHLRGSQIIEFLSEVAVNKFDPFPVMRGKQLVLVGHDGYMLGDAVLFREAEDFCRLVGALPLVNEWILYNLEESNYDVEATKDEAHWFGSGSRDVFRVQIQGPNALDLMQEVTDGTLPEIKFFNIGEFQIAGKSVRALRHGMAGAAGYEIYGAWDDQQAVREALETTGVKYGLRKVGAIAYPLTAVESAWLPIPLPAIFHTAQMKPYREWLDNFFIETIPASLGGSFVSDDITDYYVDPIEVGYKGLIDFDRNFIGRDALLEKANKQKRKKVTLEFIDDDVASVIKDSLFPCEGLPSKYMDLPLPIYSTFQSDAIMRNGNVVGISRWPAFCVNADHLLSISLVNIDDAEPGTDVTLLWGEPNSPRATVEKHELREIRAKVRPAPYFEKVIKSGPQ